MKKFEAISIAAILFLFTSTYGQETGLKPEKVSNKGRVAKTYLDLMVNGINTNIDYGRSNSAVAEYKKSVKGIQAGLSFQAGITPAFSLVSELYFIRKGGKLKNNNPLTTKESALRLNTLELPVLARFHVGRFYVNAGPSIAYNLSGKSKTDGETTKLSFKNSTDGFKRFDAGVQMGAGFEFPLKQKRVALDLRYVHGLTNITHGRELYNRALMISVHFSKRWKTSPLAKR